MQWFKNLFNKVPVDITKSSGYDEPNEHFFTSKCGELVVADITEIIPGDIASLSVSAQVQLPPMATDFYGRVDAKFFTFFVPHRLVYGGFEDTINFTPSTPYTPDVETTRTYIPGSINVPYAKLAPGTLADYLGYKVNTSLTSNTFLINNIMPFLSYHLIYDEWFRDSRLQTKLFNRRPSAGNYTLTDVASMPFVYCSSDNRLINFQGASSRLTFADGVSIFDTRQINWSKDYFTNATTLPQSGDSARVVLPVDIYGTGTTEDPYRGTTAISMTSLFGANALERWKQIKNISGGRFGELQYSIFGVYPESYICDRPIYLGQQSIPVYNRSVFQNAPTTESQSAYSRNPFLSVAAKYASPMGVGSGNLCNSRRFTEYGYLITLFALVPYATYSSGIDRMFNRYRSGDFADPTFSGIGDQEINYSELSGISDFSTVFGYTQRFAEYKFKLDKVSGLLRDRQSLSSFALQRSFDVNPMLGTEFLKIPQNYLDQVAAVDGDISRYGCWVDAGFTRKLIHKLPAYSLGTLADPKYTETVMVENGGKRLS